MSLRRSKPHARRQRREPVGPWGHYVKDVMLRNGLSYRRAYEAVNAAARADGEKSVNYGRQSIGSWIGGVIPRPDSLRWIATAWNEPIDRVSAEADTHRRWRDEQRAGLIELQANVRAREGRTFSQVLAVPRTLQPVAADLDDLRHIVAAIDDARRYMDLTVVDHLRQRLGRCTSDDGTYGAQSVLPTVLGIIGAIDSTAREAKPAIRHGLLTLGAQAAEFAGFLYRDIAAPVVADYWRDRAIEWTRETGDHAMEAYVLLKKSQAAWDQGDARRMLDLAEAAAQTAPRSLPARVRAEAAQQRARGHAMLGASLDVVERILGQAHEALAANRDSADSTLAAHYGESLLGIQGAICYCEAGRPRRALCLYKQHLSPDVFSRRDYGYFLSLMASTMAITGEPDEASRLGSESMIIATATKSGRTIQALLTLTDRLAPWSERPAVREFRDALP